MKIITKEYSIYNKIINFLKNNENIPEEKIKRIWFSKSKNLVILLKKNKMKVYEEFPKKWLESFTKEKKDIKNQQNKNLLTNNIKVVLFQNWLDKFEERNIEAYTGIKNIELRNYTLEEINKDNSKYLKIKNDYLVAYEKEYELKIEYIKEKEKFDFILSDRYIHTINFLNKRKPFKNFNFVSGYGLIFGNTILNIESTNFNIQINSVLQSEKKWQNIIETKFLKIEKKIRKKEYISFRETEPLIFGSQLARDILNIVKKNNSILTEDKIINILKNKNTKYKNVNKIGRAGMYYLIPNSNIQKLIKALLKHNYISNNGTFSLNENKILYNGMFQQSETELELHIKNGDYISPDELGHILKIARKEQKRYPILLDAIDNLEFLCRNKDKYILYIRSIPSYKILFTMKFENGFYDNKHKEIKEIIQKIIK